MGRRRWIVFSPTARSIDLHALGVADCSQWIGISRREREIEEFWARIGEGKRNGGGLTRSLEVCRCVVLTFLFTSVYQVAESGQVPSSQGR